MGKDFIKFMVLVVVIYLGFLTTFSLIGRESYPFRDMVWFLTKIFLGSSYVGFDIMKDLDPIFGPPLMVLFIMLSSILLMGSLTGRSPFPGYRVPKGAGYPKVFSKGGVGNFRREAGYVVITVVIVVVIGANLLHRNGGTYASGAFNQIRSALPFDVFACP